MASLPGFTTREVARLLRVPQPRIRSLVYAGFVTPGRGPGRRYRFSFQDVVVLRAARDLVASRVPPGRVARIVVVTGAVVVVRGGRTADQEQTQKQEREGPQHRHPPQNHCASSSRRVASAGHREVSANSSQPSMRSAPPGSARIS